MAPACLICMTDEDEDKPLLPLPCGGHFICPYNEDNECLANFFQQAINEERRYPARCCTAVLFLDDYPELPFDLVWAYQVKEREYSVLAKLRRYCANTSCATFLHPSTYEEIGGATFAKCQSCLTITCTTCKTTLLEKAINDCNNKVSPKIDGSRVLFQKCQNEQGQRCKTCEGVLSKAVAGHKCELSEVERQFKKTAKERGYQECSGCGSTIELSEACNHITCECGHDFCYCCGRKWGPRMCSFGCPLYGPAQYDSDGYNQDGFHKDTGRNRDGLTRDELIDRNGAEHSDDEPDEDEDDDEQDDEEFADLEPEFQDILAQLPPDVQEEAIQMLHIHRVQQRENNMRVENPIGGGDPDSDGEPEDDGLEDDEIQDEEDDGIQDEEHDQLQREENHDVRDEETHNGAPDIEEVEDGEGHGYEQLQDDADSDGEENREGQGYEQLQDDADSDEEENGGDYGYQQFQDDDDGNEEEEEELTEGNYFIDDDEDQSAPASPPMAVSPTSSISDPLDGENGFQDSSDSDDEYPMEMHIDS